MGLEYPPTLMEFQGRRAVSFRENEIIFQPSIFQGTVYVTGQFNIHPYPINSLFGKDSRIPSLFTTFSGDLDGKGRYKLLGLDHMLYQTGIVTYIGPKLMVKCMHIYYTWILWEKIALFEGNLQQGQGDFF